VMSVSASDGSEAAVSPAQLLFDDTDWDQAHTVTVTPVDDEAIDREVSSSIVLSLTSADQHFDDWVVLVPVVTQVRVVPLSSGCVLLRRGSPARLPVPPDRTTMNSA
jgi:hypothetical protein